MVRGSSGYIAQTGAYLANGTDPFPTANASAVTSTYDYTSGADATAAAGFLDQPTRHVDLYEISRRC